MAEEAEECLPVGIHWMVVVARAGEVDDPSGVPESTAAEAEARPFRDALRDAEDDEQIDEHSRSNLALAAVPVVAHPQTIDAVCPPDSTDSERLEVFPRHYHASHPWRRV